MRWKRLRWLLLSRIPCRLEAKGFRTIFAWEKSEFLDAFHLLYKRYRKAGFIEENPEELFFTEYQLREDSRVCVVYKGKKPEATGTLVIGEDLPSDRLYGDILGRLRKGGRVLGEITGLAAKPGTPGLFRVFRLLYRYAKPRGVTDFVISVNPRHKEFYELMMLFENIGPLREYQALRSAPAVLERLNLETAEERWKEAYRGIPEGEKVLNFFLGPLPLSEVGELMKPFNRARLFFGTEALILRDSSA